MEKPTPEELEKWNKKLADEGLSMNRGRDPRLVYSGDISVIEKYVTGRWFTTKGGRRVTTK